MNLSEHVPQECPVYVFEVLEFFVGTAQMMKSECYSKGSFVAYYFFKLIFNLLVLAHDFLYFFGVQLFKLFFLVEINLLFSHYQHR